MSMIPFIENSTSITVLIMGQAALTFEFDRFDRDQVMKLITERDVEGLKALNKPIEQIRRVIYEVDDVTVDDTGVYHKGNLVANSLTQRILDYLEKGYEAKHLVQFLARLFKNPSWNSQQVLYKFLEHKNLPITEGGYFLAYKGVTTDYLDCHTRTFDNSPGQVHEIERHEVDDNPNNLCSYGFHVGSLEYATSFGQRTVIVKVDPADVVSVTMDYNFQKMRVCKYEVVEDYERPLDDHFESRDSYEDSYEEEVEDDCEMDCCDCDCGEVMKMVTEEEVKDLLESSHDVCVKLPNYPDEVFSVLGVSKNGYMRFGGLGAIWQKVPEGAVFYYYED